ncbi:hypothetical protein CCAX7_000620 [Capsulimonas corticalis]|uniref:Uncharacterized protein n=1 Tax=Capsulimonas corticalis TaxID=2219043 RepID=A0A402CRL2_9BACT|nr:hypothetical protein [Capsulimonas corticalis]BDI28011.1 hypothetical protein CCAX7_000620 [Capsulimonas corticalis]
MLNLDQVEKVDELLREGMSPQRVATEIGLENRSKLNYHLLRAGKKIRTVRMVEDVTNVSQREKEASTA